MTRHQKRIARRVFNPLANYGAGYRYYHTTTQAKRLRK